MPQGKPLAKKLLLVGWDAADWQVIDPLLKAGRMPNLQKLIANGVAGSLQTLQPMLSPMLWTSIATGKRASKHRILGFVEPLPDETSLRPVSSKSRQVKALWNILSQSGRRTHAVGWYASHPAETINGVCVSNEFAVATPTAKPEDWPIAPGSVHPISQGELLADLRVHPADIPQALLAHFIPNIAHLNREIPAVQQLCRVLETRLAECLTTHGIITDLMEREPWDFATVYYEAIDQIGHDFMPFHPPRLEQLPADVFDAFQHVMAGVYTFHDQMLGRLIELAGADAHVVIVSDHGFLNGVDRPRAVVEPAQWHRKFGVIAANGPGLKQGGRLHGATLLDIAPTILQLFGLPVGQDMDGRVLVNAFQTPPNIARIESWEKLEDSSASPRESSLVDDPAVAIEAMRQLIELGYLAAPDEDVQRDIARAKAEQRFNLAASLLDGDDAAAALPISAALMEEFPESLRYVVLHGQSAATAGDAGALAAAIERLESITPQERHMAFFRGLLAQLRDDPRESLRHFTAAADGSPNDAWLQCRVGRACLRLRDWNQAMAAFNRAIAIDPDNPEAHYGLSVSLARLNKTSEAIEHGLQAVTLQHDFPQAHFQLGAVLSRVGMYDRAIQAFEICVAMRPNFAMAHRYLSRLYPRAGRAFDAHVARDHLARIAMLRPAEPIVD